MNRLKRTDNEIRRFGIPSLEDRVIALESIVKEMIGTGGIPISSKKDFENYQAKMNRIDIEHPRRVRDE